MIQSISQRSALKLRTSSWLPQRSCGTICGSIRGIHFTAEAPAAAALCGVRHCPKHVVAVCCARRCIAAPGSAATGGEPELPGKSPETDLPPEQQLSRSSNTPKESGGGDGGGGGKSSGGGGGGGGGSGGGNKDDGSSGATGPPSRFPKWLQVRSRWSQVEVACLIGHWAEHTE